MDKVEENAKKEEGAQEQKVHARRRRRRRTAQNEHMPKGKLKSLVVDSGAIIQGAGYRLFSTAQTFWTVQGVIDEVRDVKARQHLASLPFQLRIREPSDEALKHVAKFAQMSGDLGSLSKVDLQVLALAYMLQVEEDGGINLRNEPCSSARRALNRESSRDGDNEQTEKNTLEPLELNTSQDAYDSKPGSNDESQVYVQTSVYDGDQSSSVEDPRHGRSHDTKLTYDGEQGDNRGDPMDGRIDPRMENVFHGLSIGGEPIMDVMAEERKGESKDLVRPNDDESEPSKGLHTGELYNDKSFSLEEESSAIIGDQSTVEESSGYDNSSGDEVDGNEELTDEEDESAFDEYKQDVVVHPEPFELVVEDFPSLPGVEEPSIARKDMQSPKWLSVASSFATSEPGTLNTPENNSTNGLQSTVADRSYTIFEPDDSDLAVAEIKQTIASKNVEVEPPLDPEARNHNGPSKILNAPKTGVQVTSNTFHDDGKGWINSDNLGEANIHDGFSSARPRRKDLIKPNALTGCCTTDFSIQNVLIQIGLCVISVDGMVVRHVRNWVLRCQACFKVEHDTRRIFCARCGNNTLSRVAVSFDNLTGEMKLHLKKNPKINLRGSKYSIPRPKNNSKSNANRFDGDIVLREDQLMMGIWRQKAHRPKEAKCMFGDDISDTMGLSIRKSSNIVVGTGRRNPNATKGRERRGKKRRDNR